ncbi:MAG: 1,4-dihydroxy-2-naphthoate octaprenyltransferase [Thermomicrobiales bacterium]
MPAAMPSTDSTRPRAGSGTPRWRVWFNAVRPRSFTTSTVPIVAAAALAMVDGWIDPGLFVLMLLASICTHAACNLTNDYFDDRRGVDSAVTLGQGGALQRGDLTHDDLRNGIMVSFGIAILCAVPVIAAVGPIVLWIGIVSAAAAYLYTAGPFPLAYWALGEVTVFLTMGIGMVCGAYYVLRGNISTPAILLGTAIGMLAAAFLHANNMRDVETDRAMGKRTLANLLPRGLSIAWFAFLLFVPYALAIAMFVNEPELYPVLIVWLSFPTAYKLVERGGLATTPAQLNVITRKSAGLHLRFCTLISLGLMLAVLMVRYHSA